MAGFKASAPFTVAMRLRTPTETNKQGVASKTYSALKDSPLFYGSFRTFGGTEGVSNDGLTLIDTATINCWYDPMIKADCRVYIEETAAEYEIIGQPEDIGMRHQYLVFKVRRAGGKA